MHDRRVLLLYDEDGGSTLPNEDQDRIRASNFDVIEFLDEDECRDMYSNSNSTFPLGWRRVNDSMSLTIHFNVADIEPPAYSRTRDPSTATVSTSVDDCGFRLCYTPYDPSALAHIKFDTVHSNFTYNRYPVCDSELSFQLERALGAERLGGSDEW